MILNASTVRAAERLERRPVPVFAPIPPGRELLSPPQVGSGLLYRIGQCRMVITADHVVSRWTEEGQPLSVRVDRPAEGRTSFWSMGHTANRWFPRDCVFKHTDVTGIPLDVHFPDPTGEFSCPEDIGDADDILTSCQSHFHVVGFPCVVNLSAEMDPQTGEAREPRWNRIWSGPGYRIGNGFLHRKSPDSHFAVAVPTSVTRSASEATGLDSLSSKEMEGISGCPVWKMHVCERTGSVVRMALVGTVIQCDAEKGIFYLVAVRIRWALNPYMYDPRLAGDCAP
jgi:hypothetical protein